MVNHNYYRKLPGEIHLLYVLDLSGHYLYNFPIYRPSTRTWVDFLCELKRQGYACFLHSSTENPELEAYE